MRPRRFAHVLLLACLLAAVAAAPAGAAPGDPIFLLGPADGARVTAGTAPGLRATSVSGDSGLELRVSALPDTVDACGRINAEVAQAPGSPLPNDLTQYDFPTARWFDRPGTYYWQVNRTAANGSCETTRVREITLVAPAAATPTVRPEAPDLSTQLIPDRIGSSNGATFVIRTGGLPPSVTRTRYLALVRNSARRWQLHSAGTLTGRPVFGNGRSEVGFSTEQVPRGALGVTIFGRRRRFGGRPRERDLILRADIPWEQGPAHPSRARIDLETVILHEMGHVAGNGFHVPRGCRDTPMVVGLATGEWWRSSSDFSYRSCNAGG